MIKIEMSAELINSYNEYEDGAYFEVEINDISDFAKVFHFMNTCTLSGSPDCTFVSHFSMYVNGKKASAGDWDLLRYIIRTRYGISGMKEI